jgi:lysophospholipase L1-like esterase
MRLPGLLMLTACTVSGGPEGKDSSAPPYEGDVAGECSDGADNDRDGWFDCDDNGCWNSPECEGQDTDADADADTDIVAPTAQECFASLAPDGGLLVDYDRHGPTLGSHCMGTNHQEVTAVERVVFVGDSITVGTPPTAEDDWYRNVMATELSARFGLTAPSWPWTSADIFNGVAGTQESGDFASCAKWGARTDDIAREPHQQLQNCIPEDQRDKHNLVIMTVGGNDLFSWAQDLAAGDDPARVWQDAESAVADMEAAMMWLTEDPGRFPGGLSVIFANTYEFTDLDSARDLSTCPGALLIDVDEGLEHPDFHAMVAWMMDEYMRIAVETGTDMIFLGEQTCGHGYNNEDEDGRCYRGPDAELWFDETCMHPSADGHAAIAEMFLSVVDE